MSRLRSLVADVRSLGWGAPVRAAYEASKRAGGHAALFGHLARRPPTDAPFRSPYRPPARDTVPDAAAERALARAAEVADGRVEVFGRPLDLGPDPDWHACLDGPGRWPDDRPWWKVHVRGPARPGDVKWTWELGRHRHLVTLARAAWLDPRTDRWPDVLGRHLHGFLAANPPEVGVHWYSNLELALRAVAWIQVDALAGDRLDPDLRARLADHLYRAGGHMVAELGYTVSSMANNHLLGDALGLVVLGASFPGDPAARRWARLGRRLFDAQAARTFRPDGSTNEDSLSYTRFVLEMLAVRVGLAGPDPTLEPHRRRLRATASHLARLGVLEGPVPRFGDGDEGRVLAAYGGPDDLAGSVHLALALAGSGATAADRASHDECTWYAPAGRPATAPGAERDGHDVGGGIARAARGATTVWLKAGTGDWHGHADPTSVWIRRDRRWLVADPGTGTYNGDDRRRAWFRSSVAHDALRLDGAELLEAHRTFRWITPHDAAAHEPLDLDGAVVLWGSHTCYARLEPPRTVVRTVLVDPDGTVAVADWVSGPAGARFDLSLPLPPGVDLAVDGEALVVDGDSDDRIPLALPGRAARVEGGDGPDAGAWSASYGSWRTAVRLAVDGPVDGPVVWALGPRAGAVRTDAGAVVLGDRRVAVTWDGTSPVLAAAGEAGTTARRARTTARRAGTPADAR